MFLVTIIYTCIKSLDYIPKKMNITTCKFFKKLILISYYVPDTYDFSTLIFMITPQVR